MWAEVKNDRDSKTKFQCEGDRGLSVYLQGVYAIDGDSVQSMWYNQSVATPVYAAIGSSTSCREVWRYNITKSVKNNQKCLLQPLFTFFQAVLLLLSFYFLHF